jgi:hypothetical protein
MVKLNTALITRSSLTFQDEPPIFHRFFAERGDTLLHAFSLARDPEVTTIPGWWIDSIRMPVARRPLHSAAPQAGITRNAPPFARIHPSSTNSAIRAMGIRADANWVLPSLRATAIR